MAALARYPSVLYHAVRLTEGNFANHFDRKQPYLANRPKIIYKIDEQQGKIYWAASESFKELTGKEFRLGELEAIMIHERNDLSDTAKILLSAVAGAAIQHLMDKDIPAAYIFKNGSIKVN